MHNQLSARVDSQISSSWAYTGFAKVDQLFLFSGGGGLATRGVAMPLLGEHASPKKFLGMVRFGAYFHKFFTFKSLKISFLYKNNYKL